MPSVWCLWLGDLFCFVYNPGPDRACVATRPPARAAAPARWIAPRFCRAQGGRGASGRAQGSGMEVFCVEKKSSLLVPRWRRLGSQPRARSGHDGDRLCGASAGVGDGRRRHAQSLILAGSLLQLPRLCGVALLELRGVARAGTGRRERAPSAVWQAATPELTASARPCPLSGARAEVLPERRPDAAELATDDDGLLRAAAACADARPQAPAASSPPG